MTEQVWAVSMFKDEQDVAEGVIKHLIDEGVDGIIVADNLSQDATRERILGCRDYAATHGVRLVLEIDDEPGYYQSRKMTALAAKAVEMGATWIVPFDADEIWYATDRLGVVLRGMEPTIDVVTVPITNHFPSGIDPVGDDPFRTIQWRQKDSQRLPKVAFRWMEGCVIEQGNHGVYFPRPAKFHKNSGVALRHFPYRTFDHFKQKAINGKAAYIAAKDLPEDMGMHWRQYGQILEQHGEDALHGVFTSYFWFLAPLDAGLIHDPAPYRRWD